MVGLLARNLLTQRHCLAAIVALYLMACTVSSCAGQDTVPPPLRRFVAANLARRQTELRHVRRTRHVIFVRSLCRMLGRLPLA
jgi:hypothetical protein